MKDEAKETEKKEGDGGAKLTKVPLVREKEAEESKNEQKSDEEKKQRAPPVSKPHPAPQPLTVPPPPARGDGRGKANSEAPTQEKAQDDAASVRTQHAEPGPAPPPRLPGKDGDKPTDNAEKPTTKSDEPASKDAKDGKEKPVSSPAGPGITEKDFKAAEAKAEERQKALMDALAKLTAGVAALLEAESLEAGNVKKAGEARTKRRADKVAIAKKTEEFLTNILKDSNALKKTSDDNRKDPAKAPETKAVLDAFKSAGEAQAQFLKKLGTEIMDQNSNQHKLTQDASKQWAREQVGFNLAGYLDDFCKSIAGEVRSLLKEVGDLREQRRAMYM